MSQFDFFGDDGGMSMAVRDMRHVEPKTSKTSTTKSTSPSAAAPSSQPSNRPPLSGAGMSAPSLPFTSSPQVTPGPGPIPISVLSASPARSTTSVLSAASHTPTATPESTNKSITPLIPASPSMTPSQSGRRGSFLTNLLAPLPATLTSGSPVSSILNSLSFQHVSL